MQYYELVVLLRTYYSANSIVFRFAGENQNKQCGEGSRNRREMVRVKEIEDGMENVEESIVIHL